MYIIVNCMSTLELGALANPLRANRSLSGSPTYRFSADGSRQAGDADAMVLEPIFESDLLATVEKRSS